MILRDWLTTRLCFLYAFILCALLMSAALYLEYIVGLEPCPLCAIQRLLVIALGVLALIAYIHNPGLLWKRMYIVLAFLITVANLVVSGRHIWLQNLPADQVPDCGPGLEFILGTFPLFEALNIIFAGSGECAEVQWVFLGLSLPGWTFFVFSILLVIEIFLLFRKD